MLFQVELPLSKTVDLVSISFLVENDTLGDSEAGETRQQKIG